MNAFQTKFCNACQKRKIEPSQLILGQLVDSSAPTLSLHGYSMSAQTLSALSEALAQDTFFSRLILADCFLGDDGMSHD